MSIFFTVPGEPKSKARPRFFRKNGYVGTYTPKTTTTYENLVKLYAAKECREAPSNKPAQVVIRSYFSIPKSMSKKKRQEFASRGLLPVIKKPDTDNLGKMVLDAMNGIVYVDDAQVWHLTVIKLYSETPRTEVTVSLSLN